MRILFSTVSPADYMAPPQLSDEQIICGPDWPDAQGPDGRWRSLRTPVGEYDLATVLTRLPAEQQPEAFVSLVDASWRNVPRNITACRGPSALLVADTHHLTSPLLGMFRYAATEKYTRNVFLYDRHHLDFFHSVGFQNLYWFPGLTFPHVDSVVRGARAARRAARIAFAGQAGKLHPQRGRILAALTEAGLRLEQKAIPQREALAFYGGSQLGLNASLNGDLNLRIIEVLASGAALLTDRLAPVSGLTELWTEGRELITYGSPEELVERARHYLAHPEEAATIGQAGAAWFDTHFNQAARCTAFRDLLVNGTHAPLFADASRSRRIYFNGNTERLLQAMMVYEGVQELHRQELQVKVVLTPAVTDDVQAICETLPRVEVTRGQVDVPADIAVFTRDDEVALDAIQAPRVWCCDAQNEEFATLNDFLAPHGFSPVSNEVAVYCRVAPAENTSPVPLEMQANTPRVLVVSDDPDSGGVAQYNHSLIVALAEAGYSVSVAQGRCDNPLITQQRDLGVQHYWIPYDTKREFARTLTDSATVEGIMRECQPDLVVFSDCCPVSNMGARDAARHLRIPYVVVIGFVGSYLAERFAAHLPRLAAHYAEAREVVAVSRENLELLHQRFGLGADKGCVIHYGRPEKFFAPKDESVRQRLRQELGLDEDAVLCFTAARLAAIKGFQHQIQAARQLVGTAVGRKLHFAWAGDGELRGQLEQMVASARLSEKVHFLGHRWDVADWFDAADIFVLPSDMEGMPLAIMEAMAKGLPVAATAVSGIPEELGETGRLLPVDGASRVAALVEALQDWTNDSVLRRRDGEAGRVRAQEMFREPLMLERTVTLIARQLAETPHAISA